MLHQHALAAGLAAMLLLSACSAEDLSGKYLLRDGEAVVDDVAVPAQGMDPGANRVFYEIFPGSFSDSDGDGIGDLKGILGRLDYLNDGDPASGRSLGVDGLWLTPVFLSPSYHKYDVTDYTAIDPSFGSMEDLRALIDACHQRGMLLILDLPINHTSLKHRWFSNFVFAHKVNDPRSEWYDFYTWAPADQLPAGRTFARIPGTQDYYECNFSSSMPEMNFDCPAVRQAVADIALKYLDLGVDGFRFDAAKYLYYGDTKGNLDFWTEYAALIRSVRPDAFLVAEVWDSDGVTDAYYPALNCFDFTVSQAEGLIADTAKSGDVQKYTAYVEKYLNTVQSLRKDAVIVPFLSNHDMDRSSGYLSAATGVAQMAANLYLLGPGAPFIYYGEEIGLKGSRGGASSDANRRLGMRWGDGDTVADPGEATYDASRQTDATVRSYLAWGDSLLTHYKRLLMIRRANPEIACGEYRSLRLGDTKLGGFVSTLEGLSVAVIHNTTTRTLTADLKGTPAEALTRLEAVAGNGEVTLEGTVITVGPRTSAVLR